MAGRKTVRGQRGKIEEDSSSSKDELTSTTTMTTTVASRRRSVLSISPNGELRQRLIETAIDVKENIPEESSRRITRSSKIQLNVEQLPESCDSRKRRSSQVGPPAKRPSVEKSDSNSSDDSIQNDSGESSSSSISSTVSVSAAAKTRSFRLPVMEEENEVFESSESMRGDDYSEQHSNLDDEEVFVEGEEEEEFDEEEEEEDEDPLTRPLQNVNFDQMKRHMNEIIEVQPPSSMKSVKCVGIGSPEKVWSLMVSRDDLARATKCLLNNHPGMSPNMRCMLLDWMMEVCESENLHRETFHLAVDYVDRFLEAATVQVSQDSFQLVGTAALFVAAKYEEIYPPKCHDFANLTDGAFDSNSVRKMEILMVRSINWTLGPITSIHWLSTYLQLLGNGNTTNEDEQILGQNYFVPELLRDEFIQMCKILDYLLFETDSLAFTYRTIAAAVLFACFEPKSAVENATGFVYDQLLPVIQYVEPVVRVFEKLRQAGDPFPLNDRIPSEDIHNIQTYFKYDEVKDTVAKERICLKKKFGRFSNTKSKSRQDHQFY